MKLINRLNQKLSKYQPMIQTTGIILVLFTVIVAIWQSRLTQSQIELTLKNEELVNLPKFKLVLLQEPSNATFDQIKITPVNSEHLLNKVTMSILSHTGLANFTYYDETISTTDIKKVLVTNPWVKETAQDDNLNYFRSDIVSVPLSLCFDYVKNNKVLRDCFLYEYRFRVYDLFQI